MKEDCSAGRLSLEGLEAGPRDWTGELPEGADFWSTEELVFIGPPMLEARVESSADGSVHVTGRLTASVRVPCRRCLTDLKIPMELQLDLWFEATSDPDDEQDGVYRLGLDAAELNLVGPLREEMLLALPVYPECTPACRGYCPRCGESLDEGTCGCGGAEPDPRWDVLRGMKTDEGP